MGGVFVLGLQVISMRRSGYRTIIVYTLSPFPLGMMARDWRGQTKYRESSMACISD